MIQARHLSEDKKEVLSEYRKTTQNQSQYSIATRLLSLFSKETIEESNDEFLFEQIVGESRTKCNLKISTRTVYMQSIRRFQRFLRGEVRENGL